MGLIWGLEWKVALRRRRLFVFNLLVPLLLVAPVAFSAAPAAHASAVFTVLFVLFGTFGSAIPWIRDGERGLLRRLGATGISPSGLVAGRWAANAALDSVQLLPAMAAVVAAGDAGWPSSGRVVAALVVSLGVANALGAWIAALARSLAEAALLSAVSALFLLHAAGVFRTPVPGSYAAAVEPWVPFRLLHEAMLQVTAGAAPAPPGAPGPALFATGAALLLTLALSPPLVRSLANVGPD